MSALPELTHSLSLMRMTENILKFVYRAAKYVVCYRLVAQQSEKLAIHCGEIGIWEKLEGIVGLGGDLTYEVPL